MSQELCVSRIHAQNASAAADIEDDLVLEDMTVLVDGVTVRTGANIVFLKAVWQVVSKSVDDPIVIRRAYQHLLMNA